MTGPVEFAVDLAAGFAVGVALGGVVFGGLRLTAARLAEGRMPALLLVGSAAVRFAVVAVVLVVLVRIAPLALVPAVGGMLTVRTVLVRHALTTSTGSGRR